MSLDSESEYNYRSKKNHRGGSRANNGHFEEGEVAGMSNDDVSNGEIKGPNNFLGQSINSAIERPQFLDSREGPIVAPGKKPTGGPGGSRRPGG